MRIWLLLLVGPLLACRSAIPPRRPPPAAPLAVGVMAFERVSVVRMDRDVVLGDQTVVIRDGRIERVGPSASMAVPEGAFRIDGRGRYLMPALADMHVQL